MMRLIAYKTVRGFSMSEVLLSMFVLSIGLVTIVAVIAGSLRHSYSTQDTIIATELAQEGVELVRNVRDNDFVAGNNGFTAFSNSKHCRISVGTDLTCQNNQGNANKYYLQYSGGLYDDVDDTQERYSRYIYINKSGNNDNSRATVRSFVFWGSFRVSDIGNNGSANSCNASASCVYTEAFLTSWK